MGDHESFDKFFECWATEQSQHLKELKSASKLPLDGETRSSVFDPLVDKVLHHYEQYYQAKAVWAGRNILGMFSPTWTSSLEHAFFWIGGWRPTTAFHLLYSKSESQTDVALSELMCSLERNDLGGLSHSQYVRIDELHRRTIKEERKISEKMAKQQESLADSSMVALAHVVAEMMTDGAGVEDEEEKVDAALAPKEEGLKNVLRKADDLRLQTLKGVVGTLNPIQAVHFLIAAAELHLRVHEWGKKIDDKQSPEGLSNGFH